MGHSNSPKKWLLRVGLVLLALPIFVIGLGLGLAEEPPELLPSSTSVPLPDGESATIEEVLAMGTFESPLPKETANPRSGENDFEAEPFSPLKLRQPQGFIHFSRDLVSKGHVEEAITLLRSIPDDHPDFARAQRFIGWDLYTKELNQPRIGLTFVQRSIRESPTNGNAWQDAYRVFNRSFLPKKVADKLE
ncbi:MAG: hypothetical protein DWQ01_04090 [Planctomycetota bacterium]|nr:MAG: hypothetical protein DWQ01_04090 [Planctomycetota bacterium]